MILEFSVKDIRENWRPDWKDDNQYPDTSKTSAQRWAWEFLRRNPNYQQDWDRYVGILKPIDERLKDGSYKKETSDNINRLFSDAYGVSPPPHPSRDNCEGIRFERSKLVAASAHTGRNVNYKLSDGELLLSFDLYLPIGPQIEKARRALELHSKDFQEIHYIKTGTNPRKQQAWKRYLRLLDAESDGAKQSEMQSLIHNMVNNPTNSVSESLKRAKAIRDGDYLRIALADYVTSK